jgi:DegV family protein with EDD domain
MPGGGTRIVTDSLAWIPDELVKQHNVKIVPLHVHFGEEQFTETVDLTNEQFYSRLRESKELPKTSAPSPGEFLEAYREVAKDADAIVSIHFTSKLSATFQAATIAAGELRQEMPELKIETLDTQNAAMAQGIVVLKAAEAAAQGVAFDQIVADAKALIPKPRVYFVVETLEYLQKGGRIGRAQALIGGLLNVKPILTVEEGVVAPKGRERTRTKAMEKLCDTIATYAQGRPLGHLSVIHAVAEESARELARMIEARFKIERPTIFTELGPVIGTYVGPGAFGATFHCD